MPKPVCLCSCSRPGTLEEEGKGMRQVEQGDFSSANDCTDETFCMSTYGTRDLFFCAEHQLGQLYGKTTVNF